MPLQEIAEWIAVLRFFFGADATEMRRLQSFCVIQISKPALFAMLGIRS